jgi:hypothetical protein
MTEYGICAQVGTYTAMTAADGMQKGSQLANSSGARNDAVLSHLAEKDMVWP